MRLSAAVIRITETIVGENEVNLKIEGRLLDASVGELERTCERMLADAKRVVLDVACLTYLDRAALASFRRLRLRGVTFANGNAFVTEQLREVEQP